MARPPAVVRWAALATAALVLVAGVRACGLTGDGLVDGDGFEAQADPPRDLSPYDGLGTWVDAFDFGPAYQADGGEPPIGPEDVAEMADAGVRTIYLQVNRDDERSPDGIVDRERVDAIVRAAHARELAVVGWYLPTFRSVATDVGHLQDLLEYEVDGRHLDGVGVDIEYTEAVPDPERRNQRLLRMSREVDELAGDTPLSAIVLPPVLTEVVNTDFWPDFPWAELADHYDIWLPMSYWTDRTSSSGYRDGATYHLESVDRLRDNVGDEDVVVHGIGGIGDAVTGTDLLHFAQALAEHGAVGGSIYDWATLDDANRALLARLFADFPTIPG